MVGGARLSLPGYAPDPATAIATLHAAVDAGVVWFDTADAYCAGLHDTGANEALIARTLASHRDRVRIATKGGRSFDGTDWFDDCRPERLTACIDASLRRLGVDAIDLYYLHAPDPNVPIEESVGALAEAAATGKIVHVGVSNVTADQLARAQAVTAVTAVQNRFNLARLDGAAFARHVTTTGTAFCAWAPLEQVRDDTEVADDVAAAAADHGCTPRQLVLAWLRTAGAIPVIGPTSPPQVVEAATAPATTTWSPSQPAPPLD